MARPRRRHAKTAHPAPGEVDTSGYHNWTRSTVEAGGRDLTVVSKPGVPGHGALDPSAALLLDLVEVGEADRVLHLQCGTGLVGAAVAIAAGAGEVAMFDRNLLGVSAAERTLTANGVANASVGFATAPAADADGTFDIALIRLPEGRVPALQCIWAAFRSLRPGGRCYLAGAGDEGVRPAIRHLSELFDGADLLSYRAGHRVVVASRPPEVSALPESFTIPWLDPNRFHTFRLATRAGEVTLCSRPGVFSWERVDAGSRALLEAMEVPLGAAVLDLGCGYGTIGVAAALRATAGRVTMVDVDSEALRSARRSAKATGVGDRVEVLASDGAEAVRERRFDVVLTNPPFHVGKQTNLAIAAQFIRDAAEVLVPGGRLFLVANRTLPYERWLDERFGGFQVARDGREFKVLTASSRR